VKKMTEVLSSISTFRASENDVCGEGGITSRRFEELDLQDSSFDKSRKGAF